MKRVLFPLILVLFTVSSVSAGLDEGLVVYFTFDNVENGRILDASGNDLDAEIVANIDFVKGKYGDAIHIAAEPEGDDCVHVPADDLLKIEDEITMMAWLYHEDWDAVWGVWVDKGRYVPGKWNWSYSIGFFGSFLELGVEAPKMKMTLGGGDQMWGFIGTGPMVDRNWHHIAGSYDGKVAKMYLDGEVFYDHDQKFEFVGTNDEDLRIGCAAGNALLTFKKGSIDEFGVWRRVLTEAEIEEAMKGFLAVSPKDKIATTWADIKRQTMTFGKIAAAP